MPKFALVRMNIFNLLLCHRLCCLYSSHCQTIKVMEKIRLIVKPSCPYTHLFFYNALSFFLVMKMAYCFFRAKVGGYSDRRAISGLTIFRINWHAIGSRVGECDTFYRS